MSWNGKPYWFFRYQNILNILNFYPKGPPGATPDREIPPGRGYFRQTVGYTLDRCRFCGKTSSLIIKMFCKKPDLNEKHNKNMDPRDIIETLKKLRRL